MKKRPVYSDFVKKVAFKHNKMAFVSGPRQVGKTTLAHQIIKEGGEGNYYNWDDIEFKRRWVKDPKQLILDRPGKRQVVVFDELHKAPRWKSTLKGVYDLRHDVADILVTGSARLEVFRRGGDSLLGRYFTLRMHPFSVGELEGDNHHPNNLGKLLNRPLVASPKIFERLFRFGGFPEPYLKRDAKFWNLWRQTRVGRLVREDLRDLTQAHEISLIETCVALIPERVGSPFSVQSLSEDLEIGHPTAKRWLHWLSQIFYTYVVPPYSKKLSRSLKKQPKIYLWDWSEIQSDGIRFENMVAGHFLKACHLWTDSGLGRFELFYIRDKEKREVDFLIVREGKPWLLAECKSSRSSISPHLFYYAKKLKPFFVVQVVKESGVHERFEISPGQKGFLVSADAFLKLF